MCSVRGVVTVACALLLCGDARGTLTPYRRATADARPARRATAREFGRASSLIYGAPHERARAKGILVLAIHTQLISVTQGHFRFARARFTHARRLLLDSPPPCGCPPRTCAGCPTPSSLHSPTGRSSLSALDANIPASFLCFETSTWELRAGRPRPAAR